MITYNAACKKAFDYYRQHNKNGLNNALDLGTAWLFNGGDPEQIETGGYSITIDKASGKIEPFILPDVDNFDRLDNAKPLSIPIQYKYKSRDN